MNKKFDLVFLVGMPGVGKTYYGKYAAAKFGVDFLDLDETLVTKTRLPISLIFEKLGEDEFRKLEFQQLQELTKKCERDTIIATGGGTAHIAGAMDWMNEFGKTVWLDAEIKDLLYNLRADLMNRPLFNGLGAGDLEQKLSDLEVERRPFFTKSDYKLNVYRGLSAHLFTKRLGLSTFVKK